MRVAAPGGWWTTPPLEVTTQRAPTPHRPHTIGFSQLTARSVVVTWSAAANTGGVPLTGFDLRYWPYDSEHPDQETGATTHPADGGTDRGETLRGLAAGTAYEVKMRACNGPKDRHCSAWSADHRFTTLAGTTPTPSPSSTVPANLDVAPLTGRRAELTWDAVNGEDGTLGIYVVATDGTQPVWLRDLGPLVTSAGSAPAWSPDGTRLPYVYGALLGRALLSPELPEFPEYGRWDCVLTSTGESEHPWPAWVRDRPPGWYHEHGVYKDAESVAAWSPDGERIAFTRTIGMFENDDVDYPDGMGISLFIMAPDGSGTWQVAFINALGPALRRPPPGDDGSAG